MFTFKRLFWFLCGKRFAGGKIRDREEHVGSYYSYLSKTSWCLDQSSSGEVVVEVNRGCVLGVKWPGIAVDEM